jgi:hypothetical protein
MEFLGFILVLPLLLITNILNNYLKTVIENEELNLYKINN